MADDPARRGAATERAGNKYPGSIVIRRSDGLTQVIEVRPARLRRSVVGMLDHEPDPAFGLTASFFEAGLDRGEATGRAWPPHGTTAAGLGVEWTYAPSAEHGTPAPEPWTGT